MRGAAIQAIGISGRKDAGSALARVLQWKPAELRTFDGEIVDAHFYLAQRKTLDEAGFLGVFAQNVSPETSQAWSETTQGERWQIWLHRIEQR